MKKKLNIIILIIGILLIVSGIGISLMSGNSSSNSSKTSKKERSKDNGIDPTYYEKSEDGSFKNTSSKIGEEHTFDDITVQNMKIGIDASDQEMANFTFTIKNNGSQTLNFNTISVIFSYSDGKKFNIPLSNLKSLSPGESVDVKEQAFIQIISAVDYDVKYN